MQNNNRTHETNGGTVTRVVVAACFVVLCWLWAFCFQADSLAVRQHLLSGGQTVYERHVGAVIITLLLLLVQQVIYQFTSRLLRLFHVETVSNVFFTRSLWVQLLASLTFFLLVVFSVGTHAVDHYADRVEMRLLHGETAEALRVGEKSLETSPRLTMLRAYALAKEGQLGDRFFQYAVSGQGADLLPLHYSPADTARAAIRLMSDSHTWANIFPTDSIFHLLGAMPKGPFTTSRFLHLLCGQDSVRLGVGWQPVPRAAHDYLLVMLLMDGRLADFARLLPRYYSLDDKLPRHYQEALVLYHHTTAHPVLVYRHSVTDENFSDYQAMKKQCATRSERQVQMLEHFFETYWYYYDYVYRLRKL